MMSEPKGDIVSSQVARQVLDYWFTEYASGNLAEKQDKRWFVGGDQVDREIGQRLGIVSSLRWQAALKIGKVNLKVVWR